MLLYHRYLFLRIDGGVLDSAQVMTSYESEGIRDQGRYPIPREALGTPGSHLSGRASQVNAKRIC